MSETPNADGRILLRQRPLPDQCDYLAKQLAPHVEPGTMPREALIAVGATIVNLGAIGMAIRALVAERDAAEVELSRVKAELNARIAAESADAAAGSYAGRAEEAEAKLVVAENMRAWLGTEATKLLAEREAAMAYAREVEAERNAETARAEKAEAALAEMRDRLGKPVVQWAVMLDDTESSPLPEKVARRMASDPFRTTLLTRDTYPDTTWRLAAASQRTVLERAADEQGDGEGGGHTERPGP